MAWGELYGGKTDIPMASMLKYRKIIAGTGLLLLLAAVIAVWPLGDASAQSRKTVRELQQQMIGLEAEIAEIRGYFLEQQQNALNQESRAVLFADMEVRIGRMDTQVRKLTGQVEEMVYGQDRLLAAFEVFKADMEFRFQDLETGTVFASDENGTRDDLERNKNRAVRTADFPSENTGESEVLEVASLSEPGRQPEFLPQGTPAERYDFAFGFLMRGDYPGAEQAFLAFLDEHADHPLAGNAQYWLGETYYVRKDFPRALRAFFEGYQNFGDGNKGADSLLKLGLTLASMSQVEEACAAFLQLEIRYPDAPQNIIDMAISEITQYECS